MSFVTQPPQITMRLLASLVLHADAESEIIYTPPADRLAIITQVLFHDADGDLSITNASLGWNGGSDYATDMGTHFNNLTGGRVVGISNIELFSGGAWWIVGASADFVITWNSHGPAVTVICDVFGYLLDSTTKFPVPS